MPRHDGSIMSPMRFDVKGDIAAQSWRTENPPAFQKFPTIVATQGLLCLRQLGDLRLVELASR